MNELVMHKRQIIYSEIHPKYEPHTPLATEIDGLTALHQLQENPPSPTNTLTHRSPNHSLSASEVCRSD